MLTNTLKVLFKKLKIKIESYKNESTIWEIQKGITNSDGNICSHLLGNLTTYSAAEIGKQTISEIEQLTLPLKIIQGQYC
ncbi:hypothetical protein [Flavobacterium xanthum]|uniref:Uncharacterized protein n=1 Tax=Flavobacterium xanthum TaxID=69322 RepID=A0A1M7GME8_9FLAO|nr:hypothetical protein [Flavobacterium xanthum]SHM17440.1 hypothetical protein SAMN05443669_102439 [Flavobacterium xanthum]